MVVGVVSVVVFDFAVFVFAIFVVLGISYRISGGSSGPWRLLILCCEEHLFKVWASVFLHFTIVDPLSP
jgi:hypothetical protein